jgi:bacterioferritin-associated ferredoxin
MLSMIVCSCNAIREDEIRVAARRGCADPESAYASLGCEPQCGACLCYAQEIIDEEGGNVVQLRPKAA